ncbi:phage holin family protein [Balneolaceae bacterium ANBcel3]|nr:phage holin family protein [Balneolaceae bacterium ANBcel3]
MSPSELETFLKNIKKLPGEIKSLLEKRMELFAIEVGERITGLITNAIYRMAGIIGLSLGMILVLFAAAKLVGELVGSEALGFVLVATPILILGGMFFLKKPESMVRATRDRMLTQFLNEFSESQHEENKEHEDTGQKTNEK